MTRRPATRLSLCLAALARLPSPPSVAAFAAPGKRRDHSHAQPVDAPAGAYPERRAGGRMLLGRAVCGASTTAGVVQRRVAVMSAAALMTRRLQTGFPAAHRACGAVEIKYDPRDQLWQILCRYSLVGA